MPQPTVIQGPAYIKRGSNVVYTQDDIVIETVRSSWNPRGAITGPLGERHLSTRINVTATPVGEKELFPFYWEYAGADPPIGKSIFGTSPTALEIIPLIGNKITFARSGLTQMASVNLAPSRTMWGQMSWACLGNPTLEPTNAAYFDTIAAIGAADISFEESLVISPRVTAAWGAEATPFDAIQTEDGFEIEAITEVQEGPSAVNYGLLDIILTGVGFRCRFKPVNLTEAQYETLAQLQGAAAIVPGKPYSTPARDLVISEATVITLTLKNMGCMDAGWRFGSAQWRHGEMTFGNFRTWTTGVADAMYTVS